MDFRSGTSAAASTAMEIPIKRLEFSPNQLRRRAKEMADSLSDTRISCKASFGARHQPIDLVGKVRMRRRCVAPAHFCGGRPIGRESHQHCLSVQPPSEKYINGAVEPLRRFAIEARR
jgi:hypothetical protein